jgi:hypothetical protein
VTQPADPQQRDRVFQASGMIAAHLDCKPGKGLGRKIRADGTGRTVDDMALDVLYRLVRFDA